MHCSDCESSELRPTQLERGLVALSCASCQGALLSLLVFRDWHERNPSLRPSVTGTAERADDGSRACLCPKCGRFMTKYSIHSGTDNRLDLCAHCDEVWLDDGEWGLLQYLELLPDLPGVFTVAWQSRLRQGHREELELKRLKSALGEQDASRVLEFSDWLRPHQHSSRIMAWLRHQIDDS